MTDISAIGATLTFYGGGLNEVTFDDLSDEGTPIEFGNTEPLSTSFDLNGNLVVAHRRISPEFRLSVIPNSASDKAMRALLCSSMCSGLAVPSASDVKIESAVLYIPNRGTGIGGSYIKFGEGYLVGGSSAIGVRGEGRFESGSYRFVFKGVENFNSEVSASQSEELQTAICYEDDPIDYIYYARINSSLNARMISHPIETGALVFDQKYCEPKRVMVDAKIPTSVAAYADGQFDAILKDRGLSSSGGTNYSVRTKAGEIDNLSLIGISHDEVPDDFDMLSYHFTFQELMFSSEMGAKKTSDPSNESFHPSSAKGMQSSRPTR